MGRVRNALRSGLGAALLLLAPPACARAPQHGQDRSGAARAHPALWVVRDADTTIYLFGTIHVLTPGLTWFDRGVKTAFDRSGELVLEIVEPDPAAMRGLVTSKGMTPAGAPPLSAAVPQAEREKYARAVAASGVPAAVFDRMEPWLAGVTLSMTPLGKLGYDARNGPETVLADAAKAANKPVIGLETAEQQLGYFDALSQPAQMQFLTSTLDDLPKAGDDLKEMVGDWSRGNPDALGRVLNDNLKDSPEMAQSLLFDRNRRWAAWIKGRMDRPGAVFVAVGAGHLAGKGDVQDQLATLGLKVKRVRY